MGRKKKYRYMTATWTDSDGKRHWSYGKTKTEARQKAEEAKERYELLIDDESHLREITMMELVDLYIAEVLEVRLKPISLKPEVRSYRAAFAPIGGCRVAELTTADYQGLFDQQAGKSNYWIKSMKRRLKHILKFAESKDIIEGIGVDDLSLPHGTRNARRSLTKREKALFEEITEHDPDMLVFRLSYFCGLRPSEARALQVGDLEVKEIDGERAGILHVRGTKTEKAQRSVPVPCELLDELESACEGRDKAETVCVSATGAVSQTVLKKRWIKIRNRMIMNGLTEEQVMGIVPYSLRHTYCTNLAEQGVDIRTAQYLMGHESISMTANIYTHHTEDDQDDDWRLINAKKDE